MPFQRCIYTTHTIFQMELFVILVNGLRPLYNLISGSILVVGGVLNLPLHFIHIGIIIVINIIFITFIITRIFEQEQFTVFIR